LATDDGLLIKPEPRKPWVVVAVAAGVLAVLAGGYVASGLSGKPKPAATATAASPAPVTANPDQLPAIIIAVLPLAADAGATAAPADGDASQHLVDALKGGSERGSAFNDGVSAQLAGALSQFDGVAVTSPESSFQQRDADAPPATIGKMLGATHLLRGTASREGETLRQSSGVVAVPTAQDPQAGALPALESESEGRRPPHQVQDALNRDAGIGPFCQKPRRISAEQLLGNHFPPLQPLCKAGPLRRRERLERVLCRIFQPDRQ